MVELYNPYGEWTDLYNDLKDRTIRIAGIVPESIVDGPGIRYTIFTQGCKHNCPGCHNPQTHDFNGGKVVTLGYLVDDIVKNFNELTAGITISGGDPIEQADAVHDLLLMLSIRMPKKVDVVLYTGYTHEQLLSMYIKDTNGHLSYQMTNLLQFISILIDGPFIESERDMSLKFRGSSNQRMLKLRYEGTDYEILE